MTTSTIAVTEEQINACSRLIDENRNEVYYRVRSAHDDTVEYTVRFVDGHFTCDCPAGQNGFANCKNYCWHVRAACAHADWFKKEMHRLNQDEREAVENDPACIEEYRDYQAWQADSCIPQAALLETRLMPSVKAPEKKDIRAAKALQANRNKGFSLLK
jgi:hypothetical protein